MNHTSGTLIPCQVCGRGVWGDPNLISEDGAHCEKCQKALEKFEEKRQKLKESDTECKKKSS